MATNVITVGLAKVEVGDVAADGDAGASLSALGLTYQDTCKVAQEDPTITEHYAEEEDDPQVTTSKLGKTTVSWSLMNPSAEAMVKVFGGTATDGSWEAPEKNPVVEQTVRLTPEQGWIFLFPRVRLTAKINGDFSKKGIVLVEITGTVLKPTKAATGKMKTTPLA
jgi:hypothetical protein